ncbi:hypothetical protein [Actinophytocola oryzae]|uniref:Uncharacterized protein n=1 Tax=Actinophytocola oryzae TaxID=502181 RepID=A0A4R7V1H3_9PSEU|nr:hypothetical protein [Actinophytocola oryzae]TDV42690.1 hypothetical protein CLV71_117162 [Actinophytocola oryzae]
MDVTDWVRTRLTGAGIPDTSPTACRPQWMRDGMRAMEIFGHDDLRVVGLPGHQDVLWSIVGRDATEPVRQDIHALLVAEHGNPVDRDAVAVWLGGHRIGRLAYPDAARLRPGLIRLQRRHRRAVALPGQVRGDRDHGLGVFLSYDATAFGMRQRT